MRRGECKFQKTENGLQGVRRSQKRAGGGLFHDSTEQHEQKFKAAEQICSVLMLWNKSWYIHWEDVHCFSSIHREQISKQYSKNRSLLDNLDNWSSESSQALMSTRQLPFDYWLMTYYDWLGVTILSKFYHTWTIIQIIYNWWPCNLFASRYKWWRILNRASIRTKR